MGPSDNYTQLALSRFATTDQIKSAYRRLAKNCHPDSCSEADAETRFVQLYEAYARLIDPARRAQYDEEFPSAGLPTAEPAPHGVESPFWPTGDDAQESYPIEAESGRVRVGPHVVVRSVRWVSCRHCAGTGGSDSSDGICEYCRGIGSVARRTDVPVWFGAGGRQTKSFRSSRTGAIHLWIWGIALSLFLMTLPFQCLASYSPSMVNQADLHTKVFILDWCLFIAVPLVISCSVEVAYG